MSGTFATVFEHDLEHGDQRIGQSKADDPEQDAKDKLHRKDEGGGEIDGLLRDHRNDDIAVEGLHHEIDAKAVERHVRPA